MGTEKSSEGKELTLDYLTFTADVGPNLDSFSACAFRQAF